MSVDRFAEVGDDALGRADQKGAPVGDHLLRDESFLRAADLANRTCSRSWDRGCLGAPAAQRSVFDDTATYTEEKGVALVVEVVR